MRSILILIAVLLVPSIATAKDLYDHDIPFSVEDVQRARGLCQSKVRVDMEPDDPCMRIRTTDDQELLRRLESIRTSCLEWIDIEDRVHRLFDTYDPFVYGVSHMLLESTCQMPPELRYYLYLTHPSDHGYIESTASRLRSRVERAEQAETRRDELLSELMAAFDSLHAQRAEGLIGPKIFHELVVPLRDCEELIRRGPRIMLEGDDYAYWAERGSSCVAETSEPVLRRTREAETRDLTWLWWSLALIMVVCIIMLAFWNRRMSLLEAQVEIQRWAARIEEVRPRVESMLRDATSTMEQAQANELHAMLTALEQWVEHFGTDATKADVERSLRLANIARRGYRAPGLPATVPSANVSGHPIDLLRTLENRASS